MTKPISAPIIAGTSHARLCSYNGKAFKMFTYGAIVIFISFKPSFKLTKNVGINAKM